MNVALSSTLLRAVAAFTLLTVAAPAGRTQVDSTFAQSGPGPYAWNVPANWSTAAVVPGTVPGNTAGDIARFDGGVNVATTVNLDDGSGNPFAATLGQLNITTSVPLTIAPGAGAGGSIAFNNGPATSTLMVGTGGQVNIIAGITVSAVGLTVTNNGTLGLGAVNNGGFGVLFNGAGATTVNGVMSGAGLVTFNGTGSLALSGNNTNSGGLFVASGGVALTFVNNATAAGTGPVTLTGGTLTLSGTASTTPGLSQRQFTTGLSSDTARINFTATAGSVGTGPRTAFATGAAPGAPVTTDAEIAATTGIQYRGNLQIAVGGSYTFRIASDDGTRLFVDGVMIVQNDGGKGVAYAQSAPVNLTPGLHDVRYDFVNSGGGGGIYLGYAGPDQPVMSVVPATRIFAAEANTLGGSNTAVVLGAGVGNDFTASGTSTVLLAATATTAPTVQVGNATFAGGTTLSLTSTPGFQARGLRVGGTAGFGAAVTLALTGDGTNGANLFFDGVAGSAVASTITKTGAGTLTFTQTTAASTFAAGSAINVQAGTLQLVGIINGNNPIGTAAINLNGGNLVLDSKAGGTAFGAATQTSFNNAITTTANATIQVISNASFTGLGGAISIASGTTLTIDAIAGGNPVGSLGAQVNLTGAITGDATTILQLRSTRVSGGFLPIIPASGIVTLAGNLSGFAGGIGVGAFYTLQTTPNTLFNGRTIYLNGGTLNNYFSDFDGTGGFQSAPAAATSPIVVQAGGGFLTVGRVGAGLPSPYFLTPANKTVQLSNFSTLGGNFTVNNNNGYGLEITNGFTLAATTGFGALNASASNLVQGLTLSGVVGGGFGITKTGLGTVALTNAGNTFGGAGTVLDVLGGVLSASSDGALGNAGTAIRLNGTSTATGETFTGTSSLIVGSTANLFPGLPVSGAGIPANATVASVYNGTTVLLSANTTATATGVPVTFSTTATLRATGTFATGRAITLAGALNAFDVTQGNTLTLNGTMAISSPTAAIAKTNGGTVVFTQPQPAWDGVLTITQGAVRVTDAAALGSAVGNTVIGGQYAALELDGGVSSAEPVSLTTADNLTVGFNRNAAIRGISGSNTLSGAITLNLAGTNAGRGAIIGGASAGASLTLSGGVTASGTTTSVQTVPLYLTGEGTGVFTGAVANTITANIPILTLNKVGSGSWNFQSAAFFQLANGNTGAININEGTFILSGAGTLGNGTGTISLVQPGTLTLDNGTNVNSRLGASHPLTSYSGRINLIGNATAATTETPGTFTVNGGNTVVTITPNGQPTTLNVGAAAVVGRGTGGTALFRGTGLGTGVTGSVAVVQGSSTFGFTYIGQTGATGTTNKSIVPWALVDASTTGLGTSFLTTDSAAAAATSAANVVRPLAANEKSATLLANANVDTAAALSLTAANLTVNSLALRSGGGLTATTTLLVDSGGILAFAGNTGIAGGFLNVTAANSLVVHALGTLAISSTILNNGNGLTKSGVGALTLSANNFYTGTTAVNDGTLKLTAVNNFANVFPNQTLAVNNGTLDLNGSILYANNLQSAGAGTYMPNPTAVVTNTSGTQANLVLNTANVNFTGSITGNVAVQRSTAAGSSNDWNLYSANTFTGPLFLSGGRTQLLRDATFSNVASIEISRATLFLQNQDPLTPDNVNRVSDTAPITLRGGMLQFRGGRGSISTEALGAVTLAEGLNTIDLQSGGTNVNAADVTLASLTQAAGSRATVRFRQNIGQLGSSFARVYAATAPTLVNNILPWAVVDREFASYTAGTGFGQLSAGGYAGYATTNVNTGSATDNVRVTATGTTALTANRTVNSLAFNVSGTTTLDLGGFTLTLAGGGFIASQNTNTTVFTVSNGNLTGGAPNTPSDLYFHNSPFGNDGRTTAIAANIVNNGTGALTFVLESDANTSGSANTVTISGTNTYTGGTFISGGQIALNTPGANGTSVFAIPGDVTISGGFGNNNNTYNQNITGTVTLLAASQIAFASNVTIAGGGTLALNNFNQTIAGLTFNNNGGDTPTVSTGTGVLTLNGNLTATASSVGAVSLVSGLVDLGGAARTFNVDAITWNGQTVSLFQATLNVSAVLSNGGITKSGTGLLQLGGASTFAGGVNVTAGGLILAASSTGPVGGVTAGPVGTGTLTLAANSRLLSTAAVTLANTLVVSGNLNFAGTSNLTFTGATTIPASALTIDVYAPAQTVTFSGTFNTLATAITKTGLGTLVLPAGYTGLFTAASTGATLSLLNDGNGTGSPENLAYGGVVTSGATTLTIGRLGTTFAPYFASASNKTYQFAQLNTNGNPLTLTNNNGYGIESAGPISFPNDQSITVATATASNVIQGLTLSGQATGAGGIVKLGPGALVLNNATNSFGGAGKLIDIQGGIVAAGSDGALGNAANGVRLNVNAATAVGFRATGTFSSGRTFTLNQAANAVEVTTGNVFTVANPFAVPTATNALTKNDAGVFEITAANPTTWVGAITVNQGAVRASNAAAFGGSGQSQQNVTAMTVGGTTVTVTNGAVVAVGQPITGPGITAGTTVTAVSGNTLTLSAATTGLAGSTPGTITLTNGSATATTTNTTGLVVGQYISGAGIAVGSTITAVTAGTSITLSANATASGTVTGTVTTFGTVGTGAIVAAPAAVAGSAIQLAGGVTLPNSISAQLANNVTVGGINFGGQIQSVSGTNTLAGQAYFAFDGAFGADAGSTLNINGGIMNLGGRQIWFVGAGNINLNSAMTPGGSFTGSFGFQKYGTGTLTVTAANNGFVFTGAGSTPPVGFNVNAGTAVLSGLGSFTNNTTAAPLVILPGATLTLDNSGTAVPSRFGGRALIITGGTLNLIGNPTTPVTETLGAPTFNRGQTTITVTDNGAGTNLAFSAAANNPGQPQNGGTSPSGATALFRGTNLGTAAGPGVATIANSTGGFTFVGQTGAAGANNKGLLPWAIVDTTAAGLGVSFATADTATAILRPLSTAGGTAGTSAFGEYSNATSLTANANQLVNAASGSIPAAPAVNLNSLTFDNAANLTFGTTGPATLVSPSQLVANTLTLSSGGILVRDGTSNNSTLAGGVLSAPAASVPLTVHVAGTGAINRGTLTATSLMTGGNGNAPGLIKAGGGLLTLSTTTLSASLPNATLLANYSANTVNWQTVVNQGTLKLAGGTNTLGANNFLEVGPTGTVDLNGGSQYVQGLFTDGSVTGAAAVTAGGTVTNTAVGQATIVTNSDGRNWAGQVAGNVFYNRTGTASTTTMFVPQTYTGGTLVNGGTVTLRDYATLANTSGIDLNYAFLQLDNTGTNDLAGRLGTAPITMRGGVLLYLGRAQTASAETVGAITLAEGWNVIDSRFANSGTINSATLTAASLARPTGSAAVVQFNQTGGGADVTGQIGNTGRVLFTAAPALTNNILGPWAVSTREFASYIAGLGVGPLNGTGFAGYAGTTLATASATDNVRVTATTPLLTANATVNTLNVSAAAATTVDLGTFRLTLAGGGLLEANSTTTTTNAITNGTLTSGFASGNSVGGVPANDLYLHHLPYTGNSRILALGAAVVDNGATPVRLVLNASDGPTQTLIVANTVQTGNPVVLAGANTYTGGTVLNNGLTVVGTGGVVPAGGVALYAATLSLGYGNAAANYSATASPAPTINAANVVTLNGPSGLFLVNNTALAGLVFNNTGATTTGGGNFSPTVQTFLLGQGAAGLGTLTIGVSGIVATSNDVATTSQVLGRIDTGAGFTAAVAQILVNGVAVAPLQPTLTLQGVVGGGTITKTGLGVLGLNAQETFSGALNVTAGGVSIGLTSATGLVGNSQGGSRLSALTLASGTFLNLAAQDATLGSIAGAGTVFNLSPSNAIATAKTLNVGFDNTSTTFSGSFARASDALVSAFQVNKIGGGTLTLTGASTTTGNSATAGLQVSQGGLTYSGAGATIFTNNLVLPTGTLTLDNAGGNLNNRLGGAVQAGTTSGVTVLAVAGGEVRIVGNAAAATTESVGTFGFAGGFGKGVLTLLPNAAQGLTFTDATNFNAIASGSTGLVRGVSNTVAAGNANFVLAPAAIGAAGGSGTGANGTTTMAIRPDVLADASPTGLGTGFAVKDSASGFLRPIAAAELATLLPAGGANPTVNYGPAAATPLFGATTAVGSLTLAAGSTLALASGINTTQVDGLPMQLTVNTGGLLVQSAQTALGVGRVTTNNNLSLYFHAQANATLAGVLFGTTGGLTKDGAGTLTLASRNLYLGPTNATEGTLVLGGGDNTLPVVQTNGAPTLQNLAVAVATVDLNGFNQSVANLTTTAGARYAGTGSGGVVTSATAATLTANYTAPVVTPVAIQGSLGFTKTTNTAANTLTLTGPSTYTGATFVRGSTLTLMDAGVLANTSAVTVNYATLAVDQSGLNPAGSLNPQRTPTGGTFALNLNGGIYSFAAGGSGDYTQSLPTLNASQGHSTISVTTPPAGSSSVVTIGNLVLSADATLNLAGGSSSFFNNLPGLGQSQLVITQINGAATAVTNKILPANIISNNGEFTTYVTAATTGSNGQLFGVVTMNGTTGVLGTITQTQYDAATITAGSNPTQNIRISGTGTQTVAAGGATVNAVAVRAALTNLNLTNAADVLNLVSGGLALTNGGTVVGVVGTGRLSAGGTATGTVPLYIHNNAANTVNLAIENNAGGGVVRLVANVFNGTLTLGGANTYGGGTVVNGGNTLAVAAAGFLPAGGVTINNSTLTQTLAGNSASAGIAPTNDVTINGGGVLTFGAFANTLNSITFNNTGGTGTPTVTGGTVSLTLTAANAIIAVNDNLATVPAISGTSLIFTAAPTITTSTTANVPNGLSITGIITSTGGVLTKAGTGSLLLGGASTFAAGVNLDAGAIILAASSTGAVTNGPLGTGTLTMAGGTALVSDGTLRTVANPVVLAGNVTFGATAATAFAAATATNGVTLSGTVSLGGATRTVSVNSFLNTTTFSGVVGNTATGVGITKAGPGTLVLSSTNTYDGVTTINGGVLSATLAGSLGAPATPANSIVFGGGILQHGGTNLTDYSARFSTAGNQPIYIDTVGNTVVYATALTGSGTTLGKFGTGTLTITATATYDGITLINQGTLQVGATAVAGTLPAGGTTGLLPAATNIYDAGTLLVSLAGNQTLSGVISGAGGITKLGSGTLTVSGANNTYTGPTTLAPAAAVVHGGVILATANNALGTGAVTVLLNTNVLSAQLQLSGGITLNNSSYTTTGAGSDGAATPTNGIIRSLAGVNTLAGTVNSIGGGGSSTYRADTGSTLAFTGTVGTGGTATGQRILSLVGGGNFAFGPTSLIRDDTTTTNPTNTFGITSSNTGVTTIASVANTYTQPTTVNNGSTLNVAALANINTPSSIGTGSAAGSAADLVLDNGRLQYTGDTAQSTNRPYTIGTGGGRFDASGSTPAATLTLASAAAITLAGTNTARTLTLTGTNAGPNTLAGIVPNNGTGLTTLAKTGPGLWVLAGNSTYTGPTGITGGELRVAGNNAAAIGAVTVSGTGSLLSGTGTVGGAVSTASGGSVRGGFDITGVAATGTLATGALTVTATGGITSTIGAGGTNSTVTLGGAGLTAFTGSSLNLIGVTGFDRSVAGTWNVVTNVGTFTLNGTAVTNDPQPYGTYVEGNAPANTGPVTINTANLGFGLISGDTFNLSRVGNNLQLSFTPSAVPEPVTVGLVGAAGLGLLRVIRRRRAK